MKKIRTYQLLKTSKYQKMFSLLKFTGTIKEKGLFYDTYNDTFCIPNYFLNS